jgi:ATP-dependent RNA helicase DDX47/RRP3
MVVTFAELELNPALQEAVASLGWENPTEIQSNSIPEAFKGRDIIGLAETGSGKTGAFAIPILQSLLKNPQRLFAVVLAPTRELAFQINEVFEGLGASISLHSVCIVGGVDMMMQAITLAKKPHIIVATPGRLVDHLQNTKGFSLRNIKFLVMDEADRMLSMDFEEEINQILAVIPRERNTYLFSATMTSKVAKLQKASLVDPVKVEVSNKFQTPKNLVQQYMFIPAKWKDCYLAYLMDDFKGQTSILFCGTCNNALRTTLLLRNLGFDAICLHGQLSQEKRLGALTRFKSGQRNILVATDVASRGKKIPLTTSSPLSLFKTSPPLSSSNNPYCRRLLLTFLFPCTNSPNKQKKPKKPKNQKTTQVWTSLTWTWWSTSTFLATVKITFIGWGVRPVPGRQAGAWLSSHNTTSRLTKDSKVCLICLQTFSHSKPSP